MGMDFRIRTAHTFDPLGHHLNGGDLPNQPPRMVSPSASPRTGLSNQGVGAASYFDRF